VAPKHFQKLFVKRIEKRLEKYFLTLISRHFLRLGTEQFSFFLIYSDDILK